MDEAELALRRSQMGRSVRSFVTRAPESIGEQGPGFWVALSGATSPDANMVLVDGADQETATAVVAVVEKAGCPTLFMLAGAARDSVLGPRWQSVGVMPFMMRDLTSEQFEPDRRARRAGPGDLKVFSGLMADSFDLSGEVADFMAQLLLLDDLAAEIWLLVDHGVAVSTVLTSIVDDAVCLWCMATPPRFARRGYGRSLLTEVLSKAREQGATIGLLGATPAGRPLYEATGWTALENWPIFTNATSAQFAG